MNVVSSVTKQSVPETFLQRSSFSFSAFISLLSNWNTIVLPTKGAVLPLASTCVSMMSGAESASESDTALALTGEGSTGSSNESVSVSAL